MNKKELLRRIEALEERLTLMENREQLRGNTYPPYAPVVVPSQWQGGWTGDQLPQNSFRVTCGDTVSVCDSTFTDGDIPTTPTVQP